MQKLNVEVEVTGLMCGLIENRLTAKSYSTYKSYRKGPSYGKIITEEVDFIKGRGRSRCTHYRQASHLSAAASASATAANSPRWTRLKPVRDLVKRCTGIRRPSFQCNRGNSWMEYCHPDFPIAQSMRASALYLRPCQAVTRPRAARPRAGGTRRRSRGGSTERLRPAAGRSSADFKSRLRATSWQQETSPPAILRLSVRPARQRRICVLNYTDDRGPADPGVCPVV